MKLQFISEPIKNVDAINDVANTQSIDLDPRDFGDTEFMELSAMAAVITMEQLGTTSTYVGIETDEGEFITYEDLQSSVRELIGENHIGMVIAPKEFMTSQPDVPWILSENIVEDYNSLSSFSLNDECKQAMEEDSDGLISSSVVCPVYGKGFIKHQFTIVKDYLRHHNLDDYLAIVEASEEFH